MRTWLWAVLAVTVVVASSLGTWLVMRATEDKAPCACSGDPSPSATDVVPTEDPTSGAAIDPEAPELEVAVSEPREDSYYPEVGNDVVDALHYDLGLAWDPDAGVLTGETTLTFRAAKAADDIPLDLGETLEVSQATLDGATTEWNQDGKDLYVEGPVLADERYQLVISYAGEPEPVEAPSERSDLETVGLTVDDAGGLWTLQEPYGAFTWYPVNDQPADKALYDFTITTPSDQVGIANGALESRELLGDETVTKFHLDSPASSYLTTFAVGDYAMETDKTSSGVPLTYWAPTGDTNAMERLRVSKDAIEWIEGKLGPYPFSTGGGVVIDSLSAMETQTLPTYGNDDYALSEPVVVHELIHQWYGDQVSPSDWSDVWLNEGMTMYLQAVWEDEHGEGELGTTIDSWRASDGVLRDAAGPPGEWDEDKFGDSNIYVLPAVMWHDLRQKIGDRKFWSLAAGWPEEQARGNATREELFDYLEAETGLELTDWLTQWIEGPAAPDPL